MHLVLGCGGGSAFSLVRVGIAFSLVVSRPLIDQNWQSKPKLFLRSWEVKQSFRKSGVSLSKTHTTGRIILTYELIEHHTSKKSIVSSFISACDYSCQHYNTLSAATRFKAYCTYCIMRTAPDPLCRKGVGRVFLMLIEETVLINCGMKTKGLCSYMSYAISFK